eukprot:10908214-Alexandrium_andersonii.AAC.1
MIRRPPRSTHCISSAAYTAYRRQRQMCIRDRAFKAGTARAHEWPQHWSLRLSRDAFCAVA